MTIELVTVERTVAVCNAAKIFHIVTNRRIDPIFDVLPQLIKTLGELRDRAC